MADAERQRDYRERQQEIVERINMSLSLTAKRQLERLARYYGKPQRTMLAQILAEAENRTVKGIANKPEYYDGVAV